MFYSRAKGACFEMTPTIALPSLYREAVTLFADGNSPETVVDNLVAKGLPEPYARNLVTAAHQDYSRETH
jgi:hypothetical protein